MYSTIFTNQANFFKTLAHPRRLEVINLLRDKELSVTDIYSMLDLPQANISQHLMLMRESGVVSTRKQGKQVFYRLTDRRLVGICDSLREMVLDQLDDEERAQALRLSMKELLPVKTDPVCHMRVSPKTAGFAHEHQGETYYFCASGCIEKFKREPGKYLDKVKRG